MAIARTAKGTASSKTSGTTLTIAAVSCDQGATLVVACAWEEDQPGEEPTIVYGGRTLVEIPDTRSQRGDTIVALFKSRVRVTLPKKIEATWPSNHTARAMWATQITEASSKDVGATNDQASTTAANTGTAVTSTVADTISLAAFAVLGPGSDNPSPTAGDGHTLGQEASTAGNGAETNITLYETFEILSATGDIRSSLTLPTARQSASSIVAFSLRQTYEIVSSRHLPWNVYSGSNHVELDIEDESNTVVFRVSIPTDLFDVLTDAEVTEYVTSQCQWHSDRADVTNPVDPPDADIETRLATFHLDTIQI